MAYVKQTWKDLPNKTTPLTAGRLAHLETQYDEAVASFSQLRTSANVREYGAVGDGVTDDAAAIQSAIDSGAEVVVLPAGFRFRVNETIVIRRPVTLIGYGSKLVRVASRKILLAVLGGSGTVRDVSIIGVTTEGDLSSGNSPQLLWAHRAVGLTVRDCTALDASTGGHAIDLQGCESVLIDNCTFRGASVATLAQNEMIQVDISSRTGASSNPLSATEVFDGTPSRGVTVQNCRFEGYKGFPTCSPIGSHSNVTGRYYESIKFLNNWVGSVTAPSEDPLIRFEAVRGLTVTGNTFDMSGDPHAATRRIVDLQNNETGMNPADVNSPTPGRTNWTTPMLNLKNDISGNHFLPDPGRTVPYFGTEITPVAGNPATFDVSQLRVVVAQGIASLQGTLTVKTPGAVSSALIDIASFPKELRPVRWVSQRCVGSDGSFLSVRVRDTADISVSNFGPGTTQPAGFNVQVDLWWRVV